MLLLEAARAVHGGGGLFAVPGQFPSPRNIDFPLCAAARRYFELGPPLLQRHLSLRTATLLDRLKIMLLPLVALLLPLILVVPLAYR